MDIALINTHVDIKEYDNQDYPKVIGLHKEWEYVNRDYLSDKRRQTKAHNDLNSKRITLRTHRIGR